VSTRDGLEANTIGDAISWNSVARKDALATEPPQDARCTFCVNIWNDFEIMIAIFGLRDALGISRVLGGRDADRKR